MSNNPMSYNFEVLKKRILDTLELTDVSKKLKKIKGPTLCIGSGGSNVVASFASIVLNRKNNCCTKLFEPRDVLYENLENYKNAFICSYSGNNHGVNILKNLDIKKVLFTYGDIDDKTFNVIKCNSSMEKEKSFISLGATLMSMSVLLSYYYKDAKSFISSSIDEVMYKTFNISRDNFDYDVMSGNDTISAERYLDSTFTESGLGNILVHKKYDFCHGRSTLAYKSKRNLIYLVANRKELDNLLLDLLANRYEKIIVLESNFNDIVLDNYYLTLQAVYLSKYIAELKNIDLSIVDYDKDLCKTLYKYNGAM